jgi:hypothetical protein
LSWRDVVAGLVIESTTDDLPAVFFPIRGNLVEKEHLVKGEIVVDVVDLLRLRPPGVDLFVVIGLYKGQWLFVDINMRV